MAAALSFTACSSEDDLAQEPTAPQQPTETATKIHVSVGAGIDPATTRSAVDYTDGVRTLQFTAGDKLYIYREILGDGKLRLTGELTMKDGTLANDGLSATFEGDLRICDQFGKEATYDFGNGDPLTGSTAYLLHEGLAAGLYTIQSNGSLAINIGKMVADDVETLMTTALVVTGQYNGSAYQLSTTDTPAPILNCTIAGLKASQTYGFSLYKDGYFSTYVEHDTDASGTATFAFANTETGTGHWTLDVEQGGTVVSSIDLGNRELTSKVYNLSRIWDGYSMQKRIVDLSKLSGNYNVQDGDVLIGILSDYHKISIAAGATVTLCGATIPGRTTDEENTPWAGITCLGDATIVLADGTENYVKGYNCYYPGIQAGTTGTTLTIRGTGTLTAETGMNTTKGKGAGIGGGYNQTVGNIRIEGGTITARGNFGGAGIGSGYADGGTASCGNITITGGNVTAIGGKKAAGIGTGYTMRENLAISCTGSCGNITITGGNVTAIGGKHAAGIGTGWADSAVEENSTASCGNITISAPATGTATGGEGNPHDIGVGKDGTCGTVSVADGTIEGVVNAVVPCTFNITFKKGGVDAMVNTTEISVTGSATATLTNDGNGIVPGTSITVNMWTMKSGTLTFTATCKNIIGGGDAGTYTCTLENVTITKGTNTFDVVMQQ